MRSNSMKKYKIFIVLVSLLLCLNYCSKEEPIQPEPTNPIVKIIISPGYLRAPIDSLIQFIANGIYQNNDTLQINAEWRSDDTTVISINSIGLATCKKVGSAYIYADYQELSSKGRYIDVIPKRKTISQFLIGQITGNDVEYVDIVPDLVIPTSDSVVFDFDNDSKIDFSFRRRHYGGNNHDIMHILRAFKTNELAISSDYKAIADSILYSEIDSSDTYNLPWYMELFSNWVNTFDEGLDLTNYQEWHNGVGTMTYWYVRDGSMYGSPKYGLFSDFNDKYIGLLFYNVYNYPVYCWFKVRFDGQNIFLKEYAFTPKY